ncbi:MAG: chromate efflux transporter [Acidobacteriia bacterium]|nr:chromate efflux transporter [Terriglobia bacterium]
MPELQTGAELDHARQPSLSELALVFLKLGTIAFGGPAAHIAMMEDEFVRKRQWITRADFLDRLGAANLIPGPSSTEMAIFIGHSKRGWAGLFVAGCCFIIPAAVLVGVIAAVYVRFGSLPQVAGVLYAIKPVVIAIILQALWSLARSAIKTKILAFIGVISIVLNAIGIAPLIVLAIAGIVSVAPLWLKRRVHRTLSAIPLSGQFALLSGATAAVAIVPVSLLRLFLSFFKIGSVVFGSGYVLLAFLREEFVNHLHWITERQLIDAVAVGQFTPGPVFTTATFIGYLIAGVPGAVVATLGIFLPGFLLVAVSGPLIPKIRRSATAGAILDGVVVGSLALMAVVAWQLGRAAIIDWLAALIFVASAVALLRFRLNSAWLIGGAALIGLMVKVN